MKKLTFLRSLKSNLKCAICRNKNCPVRYYPERKKVRYSNGTRYEISCEKDRQKYIDETIK